ncbi:hypothetical protein ACFPM7_08610 [Actinokineospora guangxiensis]|uniref:Helicase XPB/Ssl2 N-terminal domain-containing protein n=1 Tax=Actinokineospora guangxiensis TaxID=1490288 RepID=A0ABW0EI69_9PSEU
MSTTAEHRAEILLARFEEGAATDIDLFVADAVLDWRLAERGDPAALSPDDVEVLLTAWFPRQVTLDRSELPGALDALRRWVGFLADEAAVREPAAVLAAIDRHAEAFAERMADERNFGLAKFWVSRMEEHGVDADDAAAVETFTAAVNRGEIEYDGEVLAEIMRRQAERSAPPPLPPVALLAESDLADLARSSALVVRFRTLLEWLGTGRALTAANQLRVGDGRELAALLGVDADRAESARSSAQLPGVSLWVAWARAARLVRTVKGSLVPVKSAVGVLERPMPLWRRACLAFGEVGPAGCLPESRDAGAPVLGPVLPEVVSQLWLSLYPAAGGKVPVELLAEITAETVSDIYGYDIDATVFGFREVLWREELAGVLAALAAAGAIELTASDDEHDRDRLAELSGRPDPDMTFARLTPLGLWAAREVLAEAGFVVPLAGDLADQPWESLCDVVREAAPEVVEAAVAAWLAERETAEAAAELAEVCAHGRSRAHRMLAWSALGGTAAAGVHQARRLRAEGGLPGAMAAEWLLRGGELASESVAESEMALALGEHLAVLSDDDALITELTTRPVDEQIAIVRTLATGAHPDRAELLAVIADGHPDGEVVAAARG